MPDESCRKCGGLLLNYTICSKCRAPVQYICRICASLTEQQYHVDFCFRIDESGLSPRKRLKLRYLQH